MSNYSDFGNQNPYGAGNPPQWGASPYGPYPPPPGFGQPKRSGCWTAMFIFGGILGVGLVCCGICGGLGYFSMEVIEEEIAASLSENPVIQTHIGEVKNAEINLWDSIREEIRNPTDGEDESWLVVNVEGTKGKGRVIGKSVTNPDTEREELREGRLELPSGQSVSLGN